MANKTKNLDLIKDVFADNENNYLCNIWCL